MNLNKDPESWAQVVPEIVFSGSRAQQVNVMAMALQDIQRLAAEADRLRRALDVARTALLRIERRSEEGRAELSKLVG